MTDPFDDFERRIADDLRAWTDAAPRRSDFAHEAQLLAESPARPRRWPVLVLAAGTVAAAAMLTLAILNLGPFSSPPSAVGSPSPTSSTEPSSAPTTDAQPTPPASSPGAEEIDLAQLAWYDVTDVYYGTPTGGDPAAESSAQPDPYTRVRVGTLDGHIAADLHLLEGARASGPFGTDVLTIQDDGTTSELSLVSALDGSAQTLFGASDVVVAATFSPDRAWIYYVPVDRATSVDRGLWRWSVADQRSAPASGAQIAEMPHDFAASWQMAWSSDGTYLVTQACRQLSCRELIHRPSDGVDRRTDEPHAQLIGVTDTNYFVHDFRGGPEVTAIDLASGDARVVAESDGMTWLVTSDRGTYVVVESFKELDPRAYRLDAISLGDGNLRTLVSRGASDPTGTTVYRTPDPANSGAVLPDGWILRWPPEGIPYMDAGVPPHEWYAGELINVATGDAIRVPPTAVATSYSDCPPIAPDELPSGASAGEMTETIGGYYRWATWGTGTDQVVQVVGVWLFTAQPGLLDAAVTVRGQPARIVPITSEGPFAVAWEEAGCRYEVQLAPGVTLDQVQEYAARY